MNILNDIMILIPEFILFITTLFLIVYGAFSGKKNQYYINILALLALIFALVVTFFAKDNTYIFNNLLYSDTFTKLMKIIVLLAAIVVFFMGDSYRKSNNLTLFEYPILLLFSVIGMLVMISSNDLITLYVSLELQSLSLYVLVAIKKDSSKSAEAGLKYFILGSLASAIILYGLSLIYADTGSTNFNTISNIISDRETLSTGITLGIIFVISGMAFKLSAAPFHMWTPDVYEGSPTSISAFLIAAPKIAALAILIRLLNEPFLNALIVWQQIIIAIALTSLVVGSITALKQTNIKRLFAYGTIGNIGYALLGIMSASESGIVATVLFISLYTIASIGTFALIMGMKREEEYIYDIDSLSGFSKSHPILAICFTLILLSMAGIPPLGGFIGKFYIFLATIEAGFTYLAIFGVIFSVISAFYYLKIIKIMYLNNLNDALTKPFDLKISYIVVISALILLLFLFYANSFIQIIRNSILNAF